MLILDFARPVVVLAMLGAEQPIPNTATHVVELSAGQALRLCAAGGACRNVAILTTCMEDIQGVVVTPVGYQAGIMVYGRPHLLLAHDMLQNGPSTLTVGDIIATAGTCKATFIHQYEEAVP